MTMAPPQPLPINISPSQNFQGSDGPWSTFQIFVGTPPTAVYLLPATSQSTIWTVMSLGCTSGAFGDGGAPDNCANLRGQLFDPTNSTSFDYDGFEDMYNRNVFFELPFTSEAALNSNVTQYKGQTAEVGSDTIRFAENGPPFESQTLACFASSSPFLGQLGLQSQNSTIANFTDGHQSLLGYLNTSGLVPSASFGYTAGSNGRNLFGSLVFGGYDADRVVADQVITEHISLPGSSGRDLQIVVSDIQIGSTSVSGLPPNATFLIDSMVSDIWLPADVCDQIASLYGLTYNSTYEVYTLDSTQLSTSMPSSLNFTLRTLDASTTTNVIIPNIDLNHQLQYTLADSTNSSASISYFPIRRANSSEQFYLGRTFLQDAYLFVDYDSQSFSVYPAAFPNTNSLTDIVPVVRGGHKSSGLSGGAIAGIVIGAVAAVALIAGLIFFFMRKSKRDRDSARFSEQPTLRPMSFDGTTINDAKPPMESEQPNQEFYSKPPMEMSGEEQDQFKPELESTAAHERHELYGSSVRRRSDQSRASVSPLPRGESIRGRMGHLRQYSDSSFGQPSPASASGTPPLSPPMTGHPSPPLEMDGSFAGPFELHGGSRAGEREVTSNPTSAADVPETLGPREEERPE